MVNVKDNIHSVCKAVVYHGLNSVHILGADYVLR